MHKFISVILLLSLVFICSCSKKSAIPEISISESLPQDIVSKCIKEDTSFNSFYKYTQENYTKKNILTKVTYRQFFRYNKDVLEYKCDNYFIIYHEWDTAYDLRRYQHKIDSVIDFWSNSPNMPSEISLYQDASKKRNNLELKNMEDSLVYEYWLCDFMKDWIDKSFEHRWTYIYDKLDNYAKQCDMECYKLEELIPCEKVWHRVLFESKLSKTYSSK